MSKTLEIMTHVIAGYRTLQETERLIQCMVESGVDYIEIQLPFSDPIGDGPTITKANQYVLDNGMTVSKGLHFFERMAQQVPIPLLIMTYINIAYAKGLNDFIIMARNIGARALIIPDFPFDVEDDEMIASAFSTAQACKMPIIPVISPNTSVQRMTHIAETMARYDNDFMVYCTQRTSTTGVRDEVQHTTHTNDAYVAYVRDAFSTKIAAGFGLSSPRAVQALRGIYDVAVIGSHIMNLYTPTPLESEEGIMQVRTFLESIRQE